MDGIALTPLLLIPLPLALLLLTPLLLALLALTPRTKSQDKMFEPASVTRLFQLTRQIGCVATGPIADCRSLVARARHEAASYAHKHAHPIPIDLLARRVANLAQVSTQEAGMRPMAVMLTMIGMDEERGGAQVRHTQK